MLVLAILFCVKLVKLKDFMGTGKNLKFELSELSFDDVFTVAEIQGWQDIFSEANEIASLITYPNGTPITSFSSSFCRLCSDFIRKSDVGARRCIKSDALIGKYNPNGPNVRKCLAAGLWDAGVNITVGGVHLANWLIGQVREEHIDSLKVLEYANEIGANPDEFLKAYQEVPVMSETKFRKIAEMLFVFVNAISEKASKNIQLKIESEKREKAVLQEVAKEQELIKANNEIKIISENLPNIIWKTDINPDGNFENTYISEIADEVLGLPLGTINNSFEKYFSYVVPEYLPKIMETIGLALKIPGQSISFSYQVIKENKELAWFESTGRGSEFENKAQFFGITVDVTKQKIIEDRLKENENLLKQAQRVARMGSYSLNVLTGEWTSSSTLDMIFGIESGYKKNVASWFQIVHPDDREMMQEYFQDNVLNKHNNFNKEYRIKQIDSGKEVWVHGMGELEFDTLGKPLRVIGTIQNISERKQFDALLLKSEERYRTLLSNLPVGVCRSTINGEVISANQAMAEMYGYSSVQELMAVPAADYYIELNSREIMLSELRENGYLLDYKTQENKKDGSLIWVSANYKLIYNEKGEETYIDEVLMDITQRVQSENELIEAKAKAEKSRERFELAMQVTLDGPWDRNLISNEIYFSPRWKEILGYKPEELPDDFSVWKQLTKPEDAEKAMEMLNRHIAGEVDKYEIEFQMQHKDGHWVDILSRAIAHFDENGEAVRVVGTHIDISERKKAEKQLKENEERFRKLTEHLPSGIAIYRPVDGGNDFQFIDVNKRAELITNASRDELVGYTLLEKFPNMAESPIYKALQKVNLSGEDEFIPSFYYKDPTREGWRENYIYKLESGEIVAIFRDTTDLKKAENSLKKQNTKLKQAKLQAEQNEARFKALHDASFGGIAIHNKGKILDCNQGLSNITGYSHNELIGMDGLLLVTEDSREMVSKNILEGYEKPYEVRGVRKNGEEFPVRLEGRTIPFKGENVRVVEFRDITELKKTEQELVVAKEKAEESDRLKSAFLANMSHEIRTPMNGILGFTSLLQEPDLSGEEQQTYIDIIQKSGDRMLNTVNDIIEISKIETGQVHLVFKDVNVNAELRDLYQFFKPETEKKGMQLFLEIELKETEALIKTDELKLTSILTNLIKNAIKYSNAGSIVVSCKKQNGYLEISVKDTGIGIPANRLKAVFDRFVQADIADRHVHEGSGLGLAITKSYVEMLGGSIWLESVEGKGSTFTFTIEYSPLAPVEKTVEVEHPKSEMKDLKRKYILVAEDDDISFMLLENILSNETCKLIQAKNGKEAVDIFKNTPEIDLILMDIKMPEMDGIEATVLIREFNKTVPIIAQTAYALEGDKEKALEAGCNNYIPKPIEKTKLIDLINRYLCD
jgi:PAS domain S-box-containing protein